MTRMENSYLLLLPKENFDEDTFNEFLRSIIPTNINIVHNDTYILYTFLDTSDLELEENIKAFMYDMNWHIKCYISSKFSDENSIYDNVEIVLNYMNQALKQNVYSEKSLLNEILSKELDDIKPFILKEYLYDQEMYSIILSLIENDLNILKTSKAIYMHRNTLINKLDRFYEKTGYDLRHFKDMYIIYNLIK